MRPTPKAVVLCGTAAMAVYPLLPAAAQTGVYTAFGVLCVLAIAAGLRRYRPARTAPWLLIGAGVSLWVLGDVALSTLELQPDGAPFPSFADALFLSGYPAVAAGVALTIRRSGVRDAAAWQDAALLVVGLSVLAWNGLLEPLVSTPDASVLARAVAVAYPLADLLVLLLVLRLVTGRGLRSGPFAVLALALACYLVADVVYAVTSLAGTFHSGGLIDLGWLASYVLIGALAVHPRMVDVCAPSPVRPLTRSRRRQVGLAAVALLAPGLLVAQEVAGRSDDVLPFAVASAVMFLLVAWRSSGLIDELEDLTHELRGREVELGRRATTDALTGLGNRGVLTARLESDLSAGVPSSVALLDVDDFKNVNDTRGHDVGDHLLIEVGRRLAAAVGPDDLVARLGGDEFAVVSARRPVQLGASLLAALEGPVSVDGLQVGVAASIGVATLASGDGIADPLRHADIAMYVAKAGGGRQAVTYRPEMSSQLVARLELRRQLAFGVRDQEFTAWMQPVVDLQTHRLVGFEGLARWVRPGGPPAPPASWLPAAEETGLVVQVDDQVLRSAVRTLVGWSHTVPGASSMTLSVNASGHTLQDEQVAERVLAVLAEEGLHPSRLVLEVTESVLVEDEGAGARLQRLREAGVRIALDDFGTGWSSLTYLRRFPVDVLKLDRSFVAGIADGEGGRAVPEAVLQLASALGLEVVAEGVETPEQAAALLALGCRTVQGFLYARPAPASELLELVQRGKVAGGPVVAAVT